MAGFGGMVRPHKNVPTVQGEPDDRCTVRRRLRIRPARRQQLGQRPVGLLGRGRQALCGRDHPRGVREHAAVQLRQGRDRAPVHQGHGHRGRVRDHVLGPDVRQGDQGHGGEDGPLRLRLHRAGHHLQLSQPRFPGRHHPVAEGRPQDRRSRLRSGEVHLVHRLLQGPEDAGSLRRADGGLRQGLSLPQGPVRGPQGQGGVQGQVRA